MVLEMNSRISTSGNVLSSHRQVSALKQHQSLASDRTDVLLSVTYLSDHCHDYPNQSYWLQLGD